MDARVKPAHDGSPSFMTLHLDTQEDLDALLRTLVEQDPRLKPVIAMTGHAPLRRRAPGFAGLAATICGQQVSTFAAAAIWARMAAAYDEVRHDHIHTARTDRLRRFGLSAAKIKTLKFIAREITEGRLDLARLADAPADEAHDTLTALHGIGPWTADIYLLFCLGHSDAWPTGDLAVQEAVRIGLGLKSRPTAKEMASIGEAWRPYRGAAAHLFWAYYKVVKANGFDPMPPEKPAKTLNAKALNAKAAKAKAVKKKALSRAAAKPATRTAAVRNASTKVVKGRVTNGR
jgi:DNA-3-methyladenine glycosylase II